MAGLFIHDHRFPTSEGKFYNSYGFDKEFFYRYQTIYKDVTIIGRGIKIDNVLAEEKVSDDINFCTINSFKSLLNRKERQKIINCLVETDYATVRLPSIIGVFAIHHLRRLKKPYIVEVVGCVWDSTYNRGVQHTFTALAMLLITRLCIRKSKYAIYVTEKFLQKRYPSNGESTGCSNVTLASCDADVLASRLESTRRRKDFKKLTLGTCASVGVRYKGQEDVIKAIAELTIEGYEIEYQLVGGGDQTYLAKIANDLGVNVKFFGAVKHADVFTWLDGIDIYVHPSKQEGLCRAIIEAMSRACPIIAADAGGVHEQIEESYIVSKGNPKEIAKAISNFSKDDMLKQSALNFENSKRYLKATLYERRFLFYDKFIKNSSK